MKHSESEKFQLLDNQINGMSLLLKLALLLPCVFGGKENVKKLKSDIANLKKQLHQLKTLPDEFNRIFSSYGWIAYDRLNLEFMQNQVNLARDGNTDAALLQFQEFYTTDKIEQEIMFMNGVDCIRPRIDLIRLANIDHKAGRFHAVIPILLMMMDGIVNDVVGRGMHSDTQELDAWDSITTIDNGLKIIHDTFRKGRHKTRTEEITEPFRNGILHGLDLGYGNASVAIKCWHYLFVIRDWANSKITEEYRRAKLSEEQKPVDLRKLIAQISQTEKVKQALDDWHATNYPKEYLDRLNSGETVPGIDQPEFVVLKFFELLQKKNYKDLSELFWGESYGEKNTRIPRVRNEFKDKSYTAHEISEIRQESPVIYEIFVKTNIAILKFRLLYQSLNEEIAMPSLKNGKWEIVWVNKNE